jgi:outer membrane protein TolC
MIAMTLLTGCAVQTASPPAVRLAGAGEAFVGVRDNVTRAPVPPGWWKLFNDPVLDAHIVRALSTNADLRVAIANLEVARAALRQTRAAQLPGVGVESGVGSIYAKDQPSSTLVPTTDYDIGLTVAYEADLFGRLRSATAAVSADAAASSAALDAARVAVVADTVSAYVDLCGALANARVAKEQVAAQQRSVDLLARQLREGEVSPLELAQARALLIRAEAVPMQLSSHGVL